jgi:hypothetical protein
MERKRGAWLTAGIAGLLIAGTATAAIASAGSASAGSASAGSAAAGNTAAPQVTQHWHLIFRAPKLSPIQQSSEEFTAVVATGKSTGWAFDGNGSDATPTAWERIGRSWKKVAFPAAKDSFVATAAASSPSNVWAFANNGLALNLSQVLRWTGSKWVVVRGFGGSIVGASVLGPKDVWVYGLVAGGFMAPSIGVWHYNGSTWTQVGKRISGGSALSDHDVWGFTPTSVEHWNGHTWTGTSVKGLLPAVDPHGLNNPSLVGILALSASNVYAIGSAQSQDEGGPMVVLHFNGHKWSKVATGDFGYGPFHNQFDSDGMGGLWIPMNGSAGGTPFLVHYAGGKLTEAVLPLNPNNIDVVSVSRIPGTTQQLAGGFTSNPGRGSNIDAVILQYS